LIIYIGVEHYPYSPKHWYLHWTVNVHATKGVHHTRDAQRTEETITYHNIVKLKFFTCTK